MSYRLLRIARGDKTPLPGFEQDDFVRGAAFSEWTSAQIIEDYTAVRQATLTLLRGLSDEAWLRVGIANNDDISARALAYIIAGHELHHLNVIQNKYLI
ncbi:DinB superfamily protein [compost metagenome]